MKLEPHLIINGKETDEYEFGTIIANYETEQLDIIIYKKKPLDEATSNSLKD